MGTLELDTIRNYLIKVGCKIEYPILVNAFKQYLYNPDPQLQSKIRTQFKDNVNRLAVVSLENNMKFIILRPEFRPQDQPDTSISSAAPKQDITQPRPRSGTVNSQPQQVVHKPNVDSREHCQRKWIIEACNCNYHGLSTLLRNDPKLAGQKDIVNGYTALHWAAKFGNLDVIQLIAGAYGVSPDVKSSAGYTPLHLACMFQRNDAVELLLKRFKASIEVRDHTGRRPVQYWKKTFNM